MNRAGWLGSSLLALLVLGSSAFADTFSIVAQPLTSSSTIVEQGPNNLYQAFITDTIFTSQVTTSPNLTGAYSVSVNFTNLPGVAIQQSSGFLQAYTTNANTNLTFTVTDLTTGDTGSAIVPFNIYDEAASNQMGLGSTSPFSHVLFLEGGGGTFQVGQAGTVSLQFGGSTFGVLDQLNNPQTSANVTGIFDLSFQPSTVVTNPVPEPSSLVLLGTGFLGMMGALRRKLRK